MNEPQTGKSMSDATVPTINDPSSSTNHIINIPSQPTLNHIESFDNWFNVVFWPGDNIFNSNYKNYPNIGLLN
jgi:hypothetical protein